MRGVKYNITFYDMKGETFSYINLTMDESIKQIKTLVKEKYDIDIKVSKHIIYNLLHRENVNPFLKKLCKIEKC